MTKRALTLQIVAASVVALSVAIWWAIVNVLFVFIHWMTRPGMETEMDFIRYAWPFRLVQPEWLSGGNNIMRWQEAEVIARLFTVFLAWLFVVVAIIIRYRRRQRRHLTGRSSQPLAGVESFL